MTSAEFRITLRKKLESVTDRALLRVFTSIKEERIFEFTGSELVKRSVELAEMYCEAQPDGVVLILLPHSPELFMIHLGLCLIGRVPAILAWPTNRVDPEKYQRNILHQLGELPAQQLLTLPSIARNLDPGLPFPATSCPIHEWERFDFTFSSNLAVPRVGKRHREHREDAVCENALFLQFSGGTTGNPKCVVVTAPMLINQLYRLGATLQFTQKDGVTSWLPLYHDMGLIACLWLPLWNLAHSVQFAASDWLMNPGLLFRFMDDYHATFCWLPNFAFSYLASQRKRALGAFNLAHVRAWINCSEPVRERSLNAFTNAFAELGVRREQCQASYAMAENVFAVTQTPIGEAPDTFSRQAINQMTPDSKTVSSLIEDKYVSSGHLLRDTALRIRNRDGALCCDGVPGVIEIQSQSLFGGYWGNDGFKRQSLTVDGWYVTGDYGFRWQDNLYVIGRMHDLMIIAGINILPEDIEQLVGTIGDLYPGRIVAFGVEDYGQGTESLAVVAEMRSEKCGSSASRLEIEIRQLVSSVIGISPRYVRVMPERWIVKSTAGKLSRRETRLRFLEELAIQSDSVGK